MAEGEMIRGLVAGPINARAREIERVCTECHLDPRITKLLIGLAERQNVEHQQMMALAQMFDRMADNMIQIMQKLGVLGSSLEKAGVVEKLKSLQAQDDAGDATFDPIKYKN